MKKALLFAAAIAALASCSEESVIGGEETLLKQNGAISFGNFNAQITRADKTGADAATELSNNFVVAGTKDYADSKNIEVFNHYNVNFVSGSANSTESNTAGWEYVNQTPVTTDYVTDITPFLRQTIKYWDYSATQYDFLAYSRGKGVTATGETPTTSYAKFTQIIMGNLGNDGVSSGQTAPVYTITGTVDEISATYISDLETVTSTNYAKQVDLKFRTMAAKIRMGIYETVPGYSVKDVKFYPSAAGDASATPTLYAGSAVFANGSGTMSIYFPTGKTTPVVKFAQAGSTTASSAVSFENLTYTTKQYEESAPAGTSETNLYLGRTSTEASYAGTNDAGHDYAYKKVLPTGSGNALTLKVDYTLVPIDGAKEVITVKGATAQVPAVYTAWQPNYAYTYLFKISDNTNGGTGGASDPAGLYPITFDAVVIDNGDGVQETITEVATPSITTYAKGVNPTSASEYPTGANIYVSLENPGTATLTTGNTKLYTATIDSGADQDITEETVANALTNYTSFKGTDGVATEQTGLTAGTSDVSDYYTLSDGVYTKCAAGSKAVEGTKYYSIADASKITDYIVTDKDGKTLTVTVASGLSIETSIATSDSPDGTAISGNFAKFTPSAAGKYVFEYNDGTNKHYKVIIVH